jgi:hypothetical protein
MNFRPTIWLAGVLISFCGAVAAQTAPLMVIEEPMPPIEAGVEFHFQLHATGGVAPYVWSVVSGDLPDDISLTAQGLLGGRPTAPETVTVTLKVEDSGHPAHSINKEFRVSVSASLLLEWLDLPKVRDNRIDGSVQVSNGSKDTFDLTVIIVAVAAQDSRATAIGYEHFALKPGVTNYKIPFGNMLPHGSYVVHADAIAEVPMKNSILRQRLQIPLPLTIVQEP